jgi:hypothetical protein
MMSACFHSSAGSKPRDCHGDGNVLVSVPMTRNDVMIILKQLFVVQQKKQQGQRMAKGGPSP